MPLWSRKKDATMRGTAYGDWRDGPMGDLVYWLLASNVLPVIAIVLAVVSLWLNLR